MADKRNLPDFDFEYCTDKRKIFRAYCKYMFTRTQSMFVYEGLPDTIPVQWLEQYLQRNGSCGIVKHNGEIYAVLGNPGGEYDAYYQPTIYTVANPWLKLSKTFTIGEDCVYARNDYDAVGLTPLISRYCGLMTENLLTVRLADINMRMMNLLSAPDDNTLQSTKQYLKDLENGKLGVVGETPFFDGLKLQSKHVGSGDYMIQFIELQQYLKGSLYNELGINANFNMKREALSGQELAMNDDALMPLIDDMLKQRRAMCDEINEMFGLDVSVDYGSTWHSNVVEKQLVAEDELGGETAASEEMAGDEAALPDDKDANALDEDGAAENVSRLNAEEGGESNESDGDGSSSDDDDRDKGSADDSEDDQSSDGGDDDSGDRGSNSTGVEETDEDSDDQSESDASGDSSEHEEDSKDEADDEKQDGVEKKKEEEEEDEEDEDK